MPLYRLDSNRFEQRPETTFEREELSERGDLPRILRGHPEVLGDELLVSWAKYVAGCVKRSVEFDCYELFDTHFKSVSN